MYRIVEGMVDVLRQRGASFSYNTEITSVEHEGERVTCLIDNKGSRYEADIFIINADAALFRGRCCTARNSRILNLERWSGPWVTLLPTWVLIESYPILICIIISWVITLRSMGKMFLGIPIHCKSLIITLLLFRNTIAIVPRRVARAYFLFVPYPVCFINLTGVMVKILWIVL